MSIHPPHGHDLSVDDLTIPDFPDEFALAQSDNPDRDLHRAAMRAHWETPQRMKIAAHSLAGQLAAGDFATCSEDTRFEIKMLSIELLAWAEECEGARPPSQRELETRRGWAHAMRRAIGRLA
ncbi:MAG: hypothetical protein KGL35_14075 [Bradyrhizobium sp.]|nr:hypothetical protein [Bradyrhizobium sp.]